MKNLILISMLLMIIEAPFKSGASSSLPVEDYKSDIINHIKDFESFRSKAYWDYGRWSIGYGTSSYEGEVITEQEASKRLEYEYNKRFKYVLENYDLNTPNTFVIAGFKYNVGHWGTGMEKALQNKNKAVIKKKLLQYVKADGEILPGLVRRRQIESQMIK